MAAIFVFTAAVGAMMGFWFNAAALVAGSVSVLAFSLLSGVVNGQDVLSGIAISIGLLATLQVSYLLGLLFSNFVGAPRKCDLLGSHLQRRRSRKWVRIFRRKEVFGSGRLLKKRRV
jgi:hypothetical protein